MSARIGQIIHGRYRVLSQIGKGGMSAVYLVQDLRSGEKFAMKEILQNDRYYSQNAAAFPQNEGNCLGFAEAELLSGLDHPAFPKIHEVIRDAEGTVFIIREYVEGETLSSLAEHKTFTEEEVIRVGALLCRQLWSLHSMNPPVIHRDIKPQNVVIRQDGTAVLIDFGIARVTSDKETDTEALGTKGFASPEQYGFSQTDARSDIYSLGVLLNWLLHREMKVRQNGKRRPGREPGKRKKSYLCWRRHSFLPQGFSLLLFSPVEAAALMSLPIR